MGSCIEDTYYFVKEQSKTGNDDFMIIHAIVERKDGLRHPHSVAYNKKTGNIHEVSNDFKNRNIILPFGLWIRLGKVSNLKQYTEYEMRKLVLATKMWEFYHLPRTTPQLKEYFEKIDNGEE
jgi:hypothetical protein